MNAKAPGYEEEKNACCVWLVAGCLLDNMQRATSHTQFFLFFRAWRLGDLAFPSMYSSKTHRRQIECGIIGWSRESSLRLHFYISARLLGLELRRVTIRHASSARSPR